MLASVQTQRRRLSLLLLAGAAVLLVGGLAFWSERLRGWVFIVYWLACLGLAGLALVAACLDLMLVRRQGREARRDLARQALRRTAQDLSERR